LREPEQNKSLEKCHKCDRAAAYVEELVVNVNLRKGALTRKLRHLLLASGINGTINILKGDLLSDQNVAARLDLLLCGQKSAQSQKTKNESVIAMESIVRKSKSRKSYTLEHRTRKTPRTQKKKKKKNGKKREKVNFVQSH
jgi:hypothetical protein